MSPTETTQSSMLLSNLLSGLIGALAGAIIGGVLSFLGSWYTTKRILAHEAELSKHARNIDLVLKFDERFNSESFKKTRAITAKSISIFRDKLATERKNRKSGVIDDPDMLLYVYNASIVKEDVFDFFEGVGLLFRRYNLDEELVWSNFYNWVAGYWYSAKEYILEGHKQDGTVWEDLKYLFDRLSEVEKHRSRLTDDDIVWDEKEIKDFLESEMRC